MKKTPPKTIRVTVPVTPQVLAQFERFSEASGLSVGKSMGDWLRDTVQGLEAMTEILEVHKKSPAQAMVKLSTYASTLQDMTEGTLQNMKTGPSPLGEGAPLAGKSLAVAKVAIRKAAAKSRSNPPSGNTGGKGRQTKSSDRGLFP